MTEKTVRIWTCDGCGKTEEVEQAAQPMAWASLIMVTPPLATTEERETAKRIHICEKCRALFHGWLKSGKRQEVDQ
jgi:hypothetical protein